jgi:hypothetical protein
MRGDVDESSQEFVTVEKPNMRVRKEQYDDHSSYLVVSAGQMSHHIS